MFVKRDSEKEEKIIEELISQDKDLQRQHDIFKAEMAFKQQLIDARKKNALTQKDISVLSGLSQQAVSRLERSGVGTIETILKYLNSMGYSLTIKKV